MTVSYVQEKGIESGTLVLDNDPTDGHLLTWYVTGRSVDVTGITPTGWTMLSSATNSSSGFNRRYGAVYYKIASGDDKTFTDFSAYTGIGEHMFEWAAGVTIDTAAGTFGHISDQVAPGTLAISVTPTAVSTVVGCGLFGSDDSLPIFHTPGAGVTVLYDQTLAGFPPRTWVGIKTGQSGPSAVDVTFTGSNGWGGISYAVHAAPAAPEPGVWLDFDGDGFTDGVSGSEDGRLTMEFPEGGTSAVSDNITDEVMSIDIDQGGTAEVTGGAGTDTATIVVQNATGKYTPDNASSSVYGKVRPGKHVWIGVNADGTLTGTGQTIYGIFAGVVREVAPIPAGAALAPTAEIICDGILQSYATPVTAADSTERSQYTFRVAILDAIGESATRRDLGVEPDTLPLSSADSTSALSVLEELNGANGTRHFIAPDSDKDVWYKYTTRNRHYKNGAAADASINAGVEHLSEVAGWRYNNDSIENHARASVDPISFPFAIAQVWTYDNIPFTLTGNQTIWANFDDYVRSPVVTVTSSGSVTSTITSFGHSAKLDLFSTGATVTRIKITGQQVERAQGISLVADDLASQASFGVHSSSDITTPLLGAAASAQGIVDHIVWRYGSRPLKRPSITTIHNWLPYLFSLRLYDQIGVTLAAVSAAAVKFEIVGRHLYCDFAASASEVDWIGSFTVAESRIQGTQTWFTLDSSTLNGPDLLAY